MNRRGFLSILTQSAAVAVGAELDVEKLLWVPGTKKIFLPPSPSIESIIQAKMDKAVLEFNRLIAEEFFRPSPFLMRIQAQMNTEFRG